MSLSLGALSAALEIEDKFSEGFEKFESHSATTLQKLSAIEGMVGALALTEFAEGIAHAFESVAEAIAAPTEKMIKFGEEIQNTSNRTSIATDELQALRVGAMEAGVGFETITSASGRLLRALGEGSQKTIDAVSKLHLSLSSLRDDPSTALETVLKALDKIPNATQRSQVGAALMGKGFMALLPVGATIDEIREKMEKFGLIIDSAGIASAKQAGAEIGFMSEVIEGTERNLGQAVVTSAAFHNGIKLLTDIVGTFSKWTQQNQATLREWVDAGIAFAARALAALVAGFGFALTVGHLLYDGWIVMRAGIAGLAVDIRLAVDLFKAFSDFSPTEATAAWKRAMTDSNAAVAKMNTDLASSNSLFGKVDAGLGTTMNKLLDFADKTDRTTGAVNKAGEAFKKNAPFTGDSSGMKTAEDALDKIFDKIDAVSSKYEIGAEATSSYQKAQMEVSAQAAALHEELSKLEEKYPELAAQITKADNAVFHLTKSWHEEVKAAELIKEQEAAQQRMTTATEEYDKAMLALHPSEELQNKLIADQVAAKDQEIDKWLKANPLMADAAEKMKALNHETAVLVAEKTGIDSFVGALGTIGQTLNGLGAGKVGSLFSGGGDLLGGMQKVGGIGGMFSDMKDMFSGDGMLGMAKSFLGNFASMMPVASAAIGLGKSVIGVFNSIFGTPEWEKVAKGLGAQLGADISDETAKAIESTEKKDNVDRAVAELLNLDKIEKDVKSFSDGVVGMVGNLMKGIKDGTVPAAEGTDELDKLFVKATGDASDAGRSVDALSIAMIRQAESLGEVTPAMQKYLDDAHHLMAEGASSIAEGLGEMMFSKGGASTTDLALAGQFGADAATFFVSGFEQEVAADGLVTALDNEKDNFQKMWDQLSKAGNTAALAVLGPFHNMETAINGADSSLKGMLKTVEGEDKIFKGMAKSGMMTTGTFSAMEHSIGATESALEKAGIAGPDALLAIHGDLQDVIDASNAFGIPIDANTQKLIDQSKAAGIAFKTDPITKLADAIEHLVDVLGGSVDQMNQLGQAATQTGNNINNATNGHPTANPVPGYAKGTDGFMDFGTGTLVMLHGVEAVIPSGPTIRPVRREKAQPQAERSTEDGMVRVENHVYLDGSLIDKRVTLGSKRGTIRIHPNAVGKF